MNNKVKMYKLKRGTSTGVQYITLWLDSIELEIGGEITLKGETDRWTVFEKYNNAISTKETLTSKRKERHPSILR